MSKSRRAEAQIITALKQVEAGRTVEDVARDMAGSTHAETDTTASESCVWQAERNGESEQRRRSGNQENRGSMEHRPVMEQARDTK